MALESKAYFSTRLAALGLSDLENDLSEMGCTTMAEFAFCCNYVPGKPDESAFIQEVVVKLTGEESSKKKPALRRIPPLLLALGYHWSSLG